MALYIANSIKSGFEIKIKICIFGVLRLKNVYGNKGN